MADRPDWEKARKKDVVRKQGSIPVDADMPPPKSRQKQPEQTKEGRALLKRLTPLYRPRLDEFARFAPDVQLTYLTRYRAMLTDITTNARTAATGKERDSLWGVFTVAEREAQSRLDQLAGAARQKLKPEPKLTLTPRSDPMPRLPKQSGGTGVREPGKPKRG